MVRYRGKNQREVIVIKYEIIDNFLKKEDFDSLKEIIISQGFPVYYNPHVVSKEDTNLEDLNFAHILYDDYMGVKSQYFDIVYGVLIQYLKPTRIIRSKVNCYPRTSRSITHKFHTDYKFSHKGAILSLNTCNGSTKIKGQGKIKSIENRLLKFDPSEPHASVSCSDQKCRWNIIVNYS